MLSNKSPFTLRHDGPGRREGGNGGSVDVAKRASNAESVVAGEYPDMFP